MLYIKSQSQAMLGPTPATTCAPQVLIQYLDWSKLVDTRHALVYALRSSFPHMNCCLDGLLPYSCSHRTNNMSSWSRAVLLLSSRFSRTSIPASQSCKPAPLHARTHEFTDEMRCLKMYADEPQPIALRNISITHRRPDTRSEGLR